MTHINIKLTSRFQVGQLFLLLFYSFGLLAQDQLIQPEPPDTFAMSINLEDVVVTAQYAPTDSKRALQNIRIIDKKTIERQGANNLEQLLQQDLNIRISQDLVLGSSMSLLGVGGENVKIMIDGIPVVGRLNGNIDLSQINLQNIERIEIVEGPMSVSYGTDALGGVINLITKKSQLSPFQLTLSQQLETKAESGTMADMGFRFGDKWLLKLNGGRDWFNGFSEDSTRSVLWNPKEQYYVDASLRHDFGKDHQLIYRFSLFDEEVQNLGDVRRPQFQPYAFDHYFLTQRLDHALLHEGSIWKHFYWQNTFGFNNFDREVNSYRFDFDSGEQEIIPGQGDTTTFNTYTGRSILASRFQKSKVNFQLGIDIKAESGSGARIIDPESERPGESQINDFAVFGSLRFEPFKALLLEPGLRLAYNSRYDAPLIPSFHTKYQITDDLSVRASYGKGFRSPSLKELFLSFIDINHFIVGNPDLTAETSDNLQLNLAFSDQWDQHRFTGKLNLFYNAIEDQIQLFPFVEEDGKIVPATANVSSEYAYFNLERSKTQGINTQLQYQWKNLTLEGGVSRVGYYNPLSETTEVEAFTYGAEFSGKLAYQWPASGTTFNLFFRMNDRLISYYPETVDGTEVARQRLQDGYTLLNGSVSQSIFKKRIELFAGVRNILNVTQVNVSGAGGGAHSGGGSSLPIGAGRSFFVRANVHLFK